MLVLGQFGSVLSHFGPEMLYLAAIQRRLVGLFWDIGLQDSDGWISGPYLEICGH